MNRSSSTTTSIRGSTNVSTSKIPQRNSTTSKTATTASTTASTTAVSAKSTKSTTTGTTTAITRPKITTTTVTISKIPVSSSIITATKKTASLSTKTAIVSSKKTITTTSKTTITSSNNSSNSSSSSSAATIITETTDTDYLQQNVEKLSLEEETITLTKEDEIPESYSVSSTFIQDTQLLVNESNSNNIVGSSNDSGSTKITTTTTATPTSSGIKKPVSTIAPKTTTTTTPTSSGIKKPTSTTSTTTTSGIKKASTTATISTSKTAIATTTKPTAVAPKKPAATSTIKKPAAITTKPTAVAPKKPAATTTKPAAAPKKPVATSTVKKPATVAPKKPAATSTIKKPTTTATTTKPTTTTTAKKPAEALAVKKPTTTTTAKKPAAALAVKKPAATTTKAVTITTKKPVAITTTTTPIKTPVKVTSTPTKVVPQSTTPTKTTTTTTTTTTHTTTSILGSPMANQQMLSSVKQGSKPAGPQNRKKPTVNPVRNLASKQSTTSSSPSKLSSALVKSNYVTGFGLLASVDTGKEATEQLKKLNHVDSNSGSNGGKGGSTLRLIKFNGKKSIVGRVVEFSVTSMRSNCCYILDAGQKIYEWRGSKSTKIQQAMALDLAGRIRNKERGSRPQSIVIEDGKKSPMEQEFWDLLSGTTKYKPSNIVEESEEEEKKSKIKDTLYCLINNSNATPEPTPVVVKTPTKTTTTTPKKSTSGIKIPLSSAKKQPPTTPSQQLQSMLSSFPLKTEIIKNVNGKNTLMKEMLLSSNSYVLDGLTEVYLWVGKQTEDFVRKQSMAKAEEILKLRKNRPSWVTTVQRIVEGAETELFKEKFIDWSRSLPISMAPIPKGRVAETKKEEFKIDSIKLNQPLPQSFTMTIDDAKGTIQVYRVKDHSMDPLPLHLYGHFYSGESYIIVYKYIQRNKEVYLTYFWQGKKSSINEKGESARLAVDMDDTIGNGITKKIRVVQNKEPIHFLNIFGGFIIIHNGVLDLDKVSTGGVLSDKVKAMYHIRSCNHHNDQFNWRVIELDDVSTNHLNTNDIFIIKSNQNRYYIWKGLNYKYNNNSNSNDNRLQLIINKLISSSSRVKQEEEEEIEEIEEEEETIVICNENEEPQSFLDNIGGNSNNRNSNSNNYFKDIQVYKPLMYQCSYSSGAFTVERVFEWDQDDLDDEDVMIFDCHTIVYLWIGRRSTQDERKASMTVVLDYIKNLNIDSRLKLIKSSQQQQQQMDGADEIITDINLEDYVYLVDSGLEPLEFTRYFHGSWDTKKSRNIGNNNNNNNTLLKVVDYLKALNRTYTLQELQNNPPRALDSTKLENYLSDDDFNSIFKMDKLSFSQQKLWKQENMKKSIGLY